MRSRYHHWPAHLYEGLNVLENWNSANKGIFYGKPASSRETTRSNYLELGLDGQGEG
jgi:hypothetical protein